MNIRNILDELRKTNPEVVVSLWNRYCEERNIKDFYIYEMNDKDFEVVFHNYRPLQIATIVQANSHRFNPKEDVYFTFFNLFLESYPDAGSVVEVAVNFRKLAEYIYTRDYDFFNGIEIPEEVMERIREIKDSMD